MVSSWSESINSHPAVTRIHELESLLPQAMQRATTPVAIEHVQRAKAVVDHFINGLRRIELVSTEGLRQADGSLSNAVQQLRDFIANANEGNLSNLNQYLDEALVVLHFSSPPPRITQTLREVEAYTEAVRRLHQEQEERVARLASQIEMRNEQNRETADSLQRQLAELITSGEAAQQRIVTEADTRIEELRAEITAEKTRLDTAIREQGLTFILDQETRSRDFTEMLAKASSDLQSRVEALTAETKGQVDSVEAEGDAIIKVLTDYQKQAENIVAITAASGVAGSYLKVAKEQLGVADRWRTIASVLLFLVLGSAIYTGYVSPLSDGNVGVEDFVEYGVTRIPVVLVLGGLWGYAARESSRHRRREAQAERLGTELTAFLPFLAEIPIETRNDLVKEAAARYFKGHALPVDNDGEDH